MRNYPKNLDEIEIGVKMKKISIRFVLAFVSIVCILFNRESESGFLLSIYKEYTQDAQKLLCFVFGSIYIAF